MCKFLIIKKDRKRLIIANCVIINYTKIIIIYVMHANDMNLPRLLSYKNPSESTHLIFLSLMDEHIQQ